MFSHFLNFNYCLEFDYYLLYWVDPFFFECWDLLNQTSFHVNDRVNLMIIYFHNLTTVSFLVPIIKVGWKFSNWNSWTQMNLVKGPCCEQEPMCTLNMDFNLFYLDIALHFHLYFIYLELLMVDHDFTVFLKSHWSRFLSFFFI